MAWVCFMEGQWVLNNPKFTFIPFKFQHDRQLEKLCDG